MTARARFANEYCLGATILLGAVAGFGTPRVRAADADPAVRFPRNKTAIELPFELLANVPYVSVRINGRGPFLFGVDTGASVLAFTAELQTELGVTVDGVGQAGGAGSASYPTGIVSAPVIVDFPGGLSVTSAVSRTISFGASWPLVGRKVYGYLGDEILRHFVVTFDYDHNTLTLAQSSAAPLTGGSTYPFRQLGGNRSPQIDGAFSMPEGATIAAPLNVDSGAGGVIVSRPLVDANDLVARARPEPFCAASWSRWIRRDTSSCSCPIRASTTHSTSTAPGYS